MEMNLPAAQAEYAVPTRLADGTAGAHTEAVADRRDARDALSLAHAPQAAWRALDASIRVRTVRHIARYVDDHRDALAATISADTGTDRFGALVREVLPAACAVDAYCCRAGAFAGRPQPARRIPTAPVVDVVSVATDARTPFLSPLADAAAALLGGSAVVLVSAPALRRSAAMVAECIEAAALPPDLFQHACAVSP